MRQIHLDFGRYSYDVQIGPGLLAESGRLLKEQGFSGRLVVVTDPVIRKLFGDALLEGLSRSFNPNILLVPPGEENKSLESAAMLYQELTNIRAERSTPVVALGGGVIGDLTGFVAATYLRGVPFIQMPTTLLAQVDSSLGGKVGIDYGRIKNRIGAFYQPRLVISDINTLNSLPNEHIENGIAEIIKTAAVRSRTFFEYLEANLDDIKNREPAKLEETVFQAARIKAEIVEKDERDQGVRALLNFGHTVGHAIEAVSSFGINHGRAVAIGMLVAAKISVTMGLLDIKEFNLLKQLTVRAGLPVRLPDVSIKGLMQAMALDKKVVNDRIRMVLLKSIGSGVIMDDLSPSLVERVLVHFNEEA